MIILRNKEFSLWNKFLTWINKRNESKEAIDESSKREEPQSSKSKNTQSFSKPQNPIIKDTTFKEVYEKCAFFGPNPYLIVIGLNRLKTKAEVKELESLMKSINLIQPSGKIEEVIYINDNVKGEKGATVQLLVFSSNTEIDSGVRLEYRDRMKWVDDFLYGNDYWKWYKSGKNCADIPIHYLYKSMPNRNKF